MRKTVFVFTVTLILFFDHSSFGQLQFVSYPADTVGWRYGSSQTAANRRAHYENDTFVVTTSIGSQNNYIYNETPVTLNGTASTFTASFDFRIDSNFSCSDGLTFWFFTSSLYGLGSTSKEGGQMGFPDTTKGFALAMKTIGCTDDIFLKKINSNSYSWSGGSGADTNIAPMLPHQYFITDSHWHHCVITYAYGNINVTFDGTLATMSGFSPIIGTGRFGFMGTNGGGRSRKSIRNIQIVTSLGTPTDSTDSFNVYVNKVCNGPQITVLTHSFSAGHKLKTWYGDGTYDSTVFTPASAGGYAIYNHVYQSPGTYTIKQKLYNGSVLLDSLSMNYENVFCATLPIKYYYESNGNCVKDAGESFIAQPILTRVDSNGVPIDTISSTSGFYYDAHGAPGCVYTFRIISMPGNFAATCPVSGTVYDTLVAGTHIMSTKYVGLDCGTGSSYDLSVSAVIPVTGVHDQWGNAYVQNAYCAPVTGTLTLHYSPKYAGMPTQISPTALSAVPGKIVWNIASLTSTTSAPVRLHWEAEHGTVPVPIGDTVHSYFAISPTSGDMVISNNNQHDVDTVRAGCDPNFIEVLPGGCFMTDTQLRFTIHFENTGNDTAHNIYVMDTLSDNVDPSSLRVVMASHQMFMSKYAAGGHTIVKFDYPNIKLLDSSHHGLCDGLVIYTINSKPGLPYGSTIESRAGIYFDVNAVVMTNTTLNTKGCPILSIGESDVRDQQPMVYPNPATDLLTITAEPHQYTSYSISSSIGKVVIEDVVSNAATKVSIGSLSPGLYYVSLIGHQGKRVLKFVKM